MKVTAIKPFLLEKTIVMGIGEHAEMSDSRAKELIANGIVAEYVETEAKQPAAKASKETKAEQAAAKADATATSEVAETASKGAEK